MGGGDSRPSLVGLTYGTVESVCPRDGPPDSVLGQCICERSLLESFLVRELNQLDFSMGFWRNNRRTSIVGGVTTLGLLRH